MSPNPLLADHDLPDFAAIRPEHLVPAVTGLIEQGRAAADAIAGSNIRDFDSVVLASERAGFALARGWSPAGHLHAVADTPEYRAAYAQAQTMLAEYGMEAAQDARLYAAYALVDATGQSPAAERAVELALRDFRLAGVALEDEAKARYRQIGVVAGRSMLARTAVSSRAISAGARDRPPPTGTTVAASVFSSIAKGPPSSVAQVSAVASAA